MSKFSVNTFRYFDKAKQEGEDKVWFEKHQDEYEAHVREPFMALVEEISHKLGGQLPGIAIRPKSVTRPLRSNRSAPGSMPVKDFSFVTLWEKQISMFEWNPAIHFQIGAGKEDNFIGVGLYMVSSRQIKALRKALVDDTDTIRKILKKKKFRDTWGDLAGETYKRFPRGFDQEGDAADLLMQKQFYVSQQLTRTEVKKKDLADRLVQEIKVALPFFNWVRSAVGVFPKEALKKRH